MTETKETWKKRLKMKARSRVIKKHARKQARKVGGVTVRHARRFVINRWDKIREVRIHIIGWFVGVGLLTLIVGLQMIWFQQSYVTNAPINGGTYAEAVRGPIQTLNPLYATSPAELSVSQLVFSSLFDYDVTGHLRSDVARKTVSKDNKVFTIHLRHDIHWQDGEKLTAKDVVFTVGLMKSPTARSVMNASWQGIDVEQVGDYTVRFTLPAAYAAFPQALTFAILPYHLLRDVNPANLRESSFSSSPVGSGPFSVRLFQVVGVGDDQKVVYLNANKDHHFSRPRLDNLQIHAFKDSESIGRALRTGEVTGASDVSSDIARVVDKDKYDLITRPVNSGVYAIFNLTNPILKDANVRKALRYATATDAVRNKVYGHPGKLYLPFIPDQVDGAESIQEPKHNTEAAAKLLNKAGWKLKNGVRMKGKTPLQIKIVTRSNSDYETALKEIVKQWGELGIQIDAQVFDTTDTSRSFTSDVLQPRGYDVLLDELVIGADPDVFAYWHSAGLINFSQYGNKNADDDLAGARTISSSQLRALKYVSFAQQWLADVPAIGLYQSNYYYVHSKATRVIGDYEKIVNPNNHYANVRYWTAELGRVYKTP